PPPFSYHVSPLLRVRPPFPTRRSSDLRAEARPALAAGGAQHVRVLQHPRLEGVELLGDAGLADGQADEVLPVEAEVVALHVADLDRKSTRLNSSHVKISYAVFCLKNKR